MHAGEERRLDVQQLGAHMKVEKRAMAKSDEVIAVSEAMAAREEQATVALTGREFGEHAERVAQRKTINLKLNQPLAPGLRLHPRCHRSDVRIDGLVYSGGFDRGHVAAVP